MPIYEAFIATDHVIPKYGVRLSERVLRNVAQAIRDGTSPMLLDHDSRERLHPTILAVDVRPTPDGQGRGVWVRYGLSETDAKRVGERRGFSVGLRVPLWPKKDETAFFTANTIAADATHFDAQDIVIVAQAIDKAVPCEAEHIYQLTDAAEVAKITLIMLTDPFVQQVASGLVVNALTTLLSRKRGRRSDPTHVEVRTIRIHGEETVIDEAIVVSRDPLVIARAIESLPAQLGHSGEPQRSARYDPTTGQWT